ncbi:MobA/MobL family protein [Fluviibacterium sp. S390]|uniref:MobA/MobL family protein n=1 Tax=Fluviibacterium sp. S390 TaxID=3415139 RepID=UPI003C7B2343
MAIYSLNLKSIGRTTHAAGTAGAHLLYIARDGAAPELVSEHMPSDPNEARAWMNRAEMGDRKNARVIDKVRIALPRELSPEQRMQLVQDFAHDLTGERVAWFAAIHAQGKDAHNPHCHLVIRDRDLDTGKRVLRLSDSPRDRAKAGLEPKAVEWVRAKWEDHANRALEAAGHEARIDRRTLEAQGIDREPTIHIGPQAAHVEEFVDRPQSKIKETGNGRSIDYPQIDEGRTRKERHAEIVDFNIEKAARSKDFRIRETAKMQRQQKALDTALEKDLIREARDRTQEARQARKAYRAELKAIQEDHRAKQRDVKAMLREDWSARRSGMTERHRGEREAMAQDHGRISARVLRVVDVTGRTRRRQDEERRDMQAKHREERSHLVAFHREHRATQMEGLDTRKEIMRREVKAAHAPDMARMADRHKQAEIEADRQRQMRAAEREQAEQKTDRLIKQAEKLYKSMQRDRSRDRGFDHGR